MKKLFLLLIAVFAISILMATPINYNTLQTVAQNWYLQATGLNPTLSQTFDTKSDGIITFYTFDFANGGFVILSSDDNVFPILAYDFDNSAPKEITDEAVKSYMKGMSKTIESLIKSGIVREDNKKLWDKIYRNDFSDFLNYSKDVSPLVSTNWDQDYPYNMYCPTENGQHTMVGCVATAMGQIMRTNAYPEHGTGSHSYNWNGQTLSADFENTTYQWTLMPNTLYSSSPMNQRQAVATLLFHCGVATEMDYGVDGSGTYTSFAESAFQLYFGYDPYTVQLRNRNSYSDEDWIAYLKADLDDGFPVLYAGDDGSMGHAFVCDGYNGNNHFHFNWGWSGYYNGYYYLSNLNPAGYNFNQDQQAVFGIRPPEQPLPPQNLTAMVLNLDVLLTWEAPSDKPLTGYKLYRDDSLLVELTNPENISYYDMHLPVGTHTYYITSVYTQGESEPSNTVTVEIGASADDNIISADKNGISQIYPNPFNSLKKAEATIEFSLNNSGKVNLSIFNIKGQKITNLLSSYKDRGNYHAYWNGKDASGKSVSAGIYFIRLSLDNNLLDIKKTLVIK